ncbi:SDR family oxidoreductase [Spirochaeta thermophila]|uniref:D-mannonate oxidoreductase n=1 Tax=Winmispira thermophila (strain ATCC 49972 / DSM 6192 / RI 19.B1) TaxID=665571 RepID=E0RQ47_WINT6|nr:SDR family oxidoreductase [Spirochaeta thermophila]ADN01431.1 D-mannonate oxidoreductase [Spirochaeta thermophila DSM 6192]
MKMQPLWDLSDEVVVITGGTGMIGKAFAVALAGSGAKVAIWGRGKTVPVEASVEEVKERLEGEGEVIGCAVDTGDMEAVERGFQEVEERLGTPTVLINGVGGNRGKAGFLEMDVSWFEDVFRLNLMSGMVIPTQVFGRRWVEKKVQGSVVNIASMASYKPLSGVYAYAAAKAAVMNLTMGLAKELAPHGIRVNAIAPGFFVGHQNRELLYDDYQAGKLSDRGRQIIARTPFGRFGEEEDLYGAVIFLASRKASGFVTGVTIPVDGGFLVDNI